MEKIEITEKERDIANEEAMYLYGYLRKKYANENCQDLDILLNSLCFALLRMILMHVNPSDYISMVKIINTILMEEIKKD